MDCVCCDNCRSKNCNKYVNRQIMLVCAINHLVDSCVVNRMIIIVRVKNLDYCIADQAHMFVHAQQK